MAVENENKLSEIIQAFADAVSSMTLFSLVLGALAFMSNSLKALCQAFARPTLIFTFPIANEPTPRTLVSDLNQLTMTIFRIR